MKRRFAASIMRLISFLAIFTVPALLILTGCSNKNSLVGKWKMVYLTSKIPYSKDTFRVDLADTAAMNKTLRDRIPQSEWNNPTIFGHHCYLQLNSDSTLRMYDIRVFTLRFGNLGSEYGGTWGIEQDNKLRLEFLKGEQKMAPVYFTIEKQSPDSLILLSKRAGDYEYYHQVKMARE